MKNNDVGSAQTSAPNNYTDTRPFWEAVARGKLAIQYDSKTGQPQWYPRSISVSSGLRNLEWREVSGNGTIYSWTTTLRAWPGHERRVPYVCALVDLEEGVRILVNLVDCAAEDIHVGQPVKAQFEEVPADHRFPMFGPR